MFHTFAEKFIQSQCNSDIECMREDELFALRKLDEFRHFGYQLLEELKFIDERLFALKSKCHANVI